MTALTDRARVLKRRKDLYIHQGATYRHDWVYLDAADEPIDITDYTALLQIRPHALAEALLYEGTTDNDIFIDGAAGLVELAIPAEITGAWTWRTGEYQLDLITPGGVGGQDRLGQSAQPGRRHTRGLNMIETSVTAATICASLATLSRLLHESHVIIAPCYWRRRAQQAGREFTAQDVQKLIERAPKRIAPRQA